MGYPLKAETNGSGGAKNILTKKEIEECDGIIIAADKNVEMARFDGKPVIKTSVTNGINKPEEFIQKIVDGKASVYHANDEEKSAVDDDEKESFGHKIYKHLMNGVSHMLPFVVGGGVLIAFGFLIDTIAGNANVGGTFGFTSPVASVVFWIGKAAFALMLPVLSAYIAQSIADRPGLLPGFVGGVFAASGHTIQSMVDGVNSGNGLAGDSKAVSGFLGALFAGFIAGIVVQLIKKAFDAGKQVITATQMLDSMIKNPRPTRAETTDVANAIYDGTSGIMLSGETAAGLYPVESVKTMSLIAERTEMDIDYIGRFEKACRNERPNVTSAISHATCTTAHDLGATAIMTVSKSGKTASMISKYRPQCMIVGGTTSKKVWRQMNILWGVKPIMVEEKQNTDDLFNHVIEVAEREGLVKNGDIAVITAGIPLGISGTTNMLKVHLVGDILASGTTVVGSGIACGSLCVCNTEDEAIEKFRDGDILVLPKTSNRVLPLIKKASGVITEINGPTSHAAIACLALGKPVIVGAENATRLLKDGTTVTMDAGKSIVFSK